MKLGDRGQPRTHTRVAAPKRARGARRVSTDQWDTDGHPRPTDDPESEERSLGGAGRWGRIPCTWKGLIPGGRTRERDVYPCRGRGKVHPVSPTVAEGSTGVLTLLTTMLCNIVTTGALCCPQRPRTLDVVVARDPSR